MRRRDFLRGAGALALGAGFGGLSSASGRPANKVKPIEGSFFQFQHILPVEATTWNPALEKFTAGQWAAQVKEMADAGLRCQVLINIAGYGKTFYPSAFLPQHKLGCDDPLEIVLSAADRLGVKMFISNGFFGDWHQPEFLMTDPEVRKLQARAMAEVAEKYSRHPSFYGWYYPNELGIRGHFPEPFIDYVKACSAEVRRLMPKAKTLIAPYGTRNVAADDEFVRRLERLDVDFVAYQDGIGVEMTKVEESAGFFERLLGLHEKAGRSRLWADVEVFRFAGPIGQSALLPAPSERVIRQLEAVSPYVEKILIFQYGGLINRPGSPSFAGPAESVELYQGLAQSGYLIPAEPTSPGGIPA